MNQEASAAFVAVVDKLQAVWPTLVAKEILNASLALGISFILGALATFGLIKALKIDTEESKRLRPVWDGMDKIGLIILACAAILICLGIFAGNISNLIYPQAAALQSIIPHHG
jgi:hypothetical protein